MNNEKCLSCREAGRCKDSRSSWLFFIIGLVATIAIRLVTVLIHVDPVYGKISWYVGIGGFLIFFIYKFRIAQSRSKVIIQRSLVSKIEQRAQLEEADYSLVRDILCSLSSNKEKLNYFFIFVLSAVALVLALYFDFLRG